MIVKKLSEIVDLQKGKKPKISSKSVENLPYLTAKYIRGEAEPEYGIPDSEGSVVVSHEDYVIIMDGSNSGEVFTGLNGILASTMGKLVLKEKINMKYLGYFLDSNKELFNKTKTGSAIPHLSKEIFFSLQIPVPSLQEQEKIVERLDSVFQLLKLYKKNNNKISAFFDINKESYILHIFKEMITQNKWDMKNLQDLNKVVVGYVGPISSAYSHDDSGIYLLSTKNISFDGLSLKKETKVLESFHNKNKKSQLNPGDIIVARHGNSGQSAVIPDTLTKSHALNVIIIKKSEYINPKYLNYLLNSGVLTEINQSKTGSVQQIINTKIIRDLKIPLPPIEEQNILVDKIEEYFKVLNDLKAIETKKLNLYINLEKSTLSKEFAYE